MATKIVYTIRVVGPRPETKQVLKALGQLHKYTARKPESDMGKIVEKGRTDGSYCPTSSAGS